MPDLQLAIALGNGRGASPLRRGDLAVACDGRLIRKLVGNVPKPVPTSGTVIEVDLQNAGNSHFSHISFLGHMIETILSPT
jgi:hypothetical protein